MCAAEQTGIRAVEIISAHGESKAQTLEPLGDVKVIKVEEIKDVEQTTF